MTARTITPLIGACLEIVCQYYMYYAQTQPECIVRITGVFLAVVDFFFVILFFVNVI